MVRILFEVVCGIVGLTSAGIAIYGFFVMRNAAGETLEVDRGKKLALVGGIGFLVSVIIVSVLVLTGSRGERQEVGTDGVALDLTQGGSFGARLGEFSKIKSHSPVRDEKNVPRNTTLLIAASEALLAGSIADAAGALKKESILIQEVTSAGSRVQPIDATVTLSADTTMIKIVPASPLGTANQRSLYTVTLTSKILRASGDSLFGATGGYAWKFEVSGIIDNTPPSVEYVLPLAGSAVPRNHLIQLTFSEPIDPSIVEGGKIEVRVDAKPLEGRLSFGNNFRTVTFTPAELCGTRNSCNETMYCLPAGKSVQVIARAARLLNEKSAEMPYRAQAPFDGITDAAGNSLDGGGLGGKEKNGTAEGPEKDSYTWQFKSNADITKDPLYITRIKPGRDAVEIGSTAPVEVDFSTFMDVTTLDPLTAVLTQDLNYWTRSAHDIPGKHTTLTIEHDPFKREALYSPEIRAEVHDITQQCFAPCKGPL